MKKIYLSALTIVFGFGLNAQTLTVANHAPSNGDQYTTYQCDSTDVSTGGSGAGTVWTFSTLTAAATHSSVVNNYTASSITNTNYPSASISITSTTANVRYLSSSATDLRYWGGNFSVAGFPASITFTQASFNAAYPMSLNTTTAGAVAGSLTVMGANGTFVGGSNVTADGTGTLALPGRTFTNVMRVVTSVTINWTAALNGTLTQIDHDYYSIEDSKFPILSINATTVTAPPNPTSTQSFVTIQKNYQTVGISKYNKEETALSVYPNPASSILSFVNENNHAGFITVYDVAGKLIERASLNNAQLHLDVSGYENGLYIYKLSDLNNQVLKTGKITIAH